MESEKPIDKSLFQESEEVKSKASLDLLYHVSREFATALDLREVLERVLLLSMQTVGAVTGSIIVIDDSGKPVESAIVTGDQVHRQTTGRLRVTLERGLAGWVVRNRQAVLVSDTSLDERWLSRRYEPDSQASPRSVVSAPLLVRDRLVGVITLSHQDAGFFTQDHRALVQAIADQAAISVLNARLYSESQRQARVMSALAESAAAITASLNLEDVLVHILEQISSALQAPAVSLALIDPQGEDLIFKAATGWENQKAASSRIKLGQGVTGWSAKEGRGIVVTDVRKESRYDPEVEERTGIQVRSLACAPIRFRGQIIGMLEALHPEPGGFDPDALFVLIGIGSLAGTAIRHAQLFEQLQLAHQRYRELFEDSIDSILVTDWDGQILEANRQAVLKISDGIGLLLDRNISELHQPDQERLGPGFERLRDGSTISYESILHTSASKEIPVQVYARQVDIDGVLQVQWIMRDITERKNLDTLREDLLSMIYHDLRSPLANVVSGLDTARYLVTDEMDPQIGYLLEIAIRSTNRIERLTSSLLDLQQLEAGRPLIKPKPLDISALVSDAVENIRPLLETKEQEITIELSPDLPQIMGDADMLHRVLMNLLENASKYLPDNGRIIVGGIQDGQSLKLWVEDNGPGIPDSEKERIFDKYIRLDPSGSSKGTGIGLTYCRLVVEGHGGRIWVEPAQDIGARFAFTLPVVSDLNNEEA
jgi:two-component system, NtrC family, sensor histidine kinase KinB